MQAFITVDVEYSLSTCAHEIMKRIAVYCFYLVKNGCCFMAEPWLLLLSSGLVAAEGVASLVANNFTRFQVQELKLSDRPYYAVITGQCEGCGKQQIRIRTALQYEEKTKR